MDDVQLALQSWRSGCGFQSLIFLFGLFRLGLVLVAILSKAGDFPSQTPPIGAVIDRLALPVVTAFFIFEILLKMPLLS